MMTAPSRRSMRVLAPALLLAVAAGLAPPALPAEAAGFVSCGSLGVCLDLNDDGFDDAVVGNPYATVNGRAEAGTVTVLFGDADGRIGEGGRRTLTQADGGSRPEVGDHFGWSIAVNDLGLGGAPTVLVGSPDEDAPGGVDAGIVQVFQFQRDPDRVLGSTATQADAGGTVEAGDQFGYSVALGDNRGRDNGFTVVGAPGEDVGGQADVGVINTFVADDGRSGTVPRLGGGTEVSQGTGVFPGTPRPGDRFGASVVICDLPREPFVHWAVIGAPGDEVDGHPGAGSVTVVSLEDAWGADQGWDLQAPVQVITQNSPDVPGGAEDGDGFGTSLAFGDPRSRGGTYTFAIGSPGEDVGQVADAGMVTLFTGVDVTLQPLRGLDQNASGWGTAEAGDRFGASVAIRPVDDGLVVGVPGEDVGRLRDLGAISVATGPLARLGGFRTLTLDAAGVPGAARSGDRFGTAVGAQAGVRESVLLAGVPRRSGGSVVVFSSRSVPVRAWTAGQGGIPATERFGAVVHGQEAR